MDFATTHKVQGQGLLKAAIQKSGTRTAADNLGKTLNLLLLSHNLTHLDGAIFSSKSPAQCVFRTH